MTLKQQVMSGLKWSLFAKLFVQIISWISTFYVIRLLTPQDYGVVAIYSIFYSFITIFAINGFLSALIKAQTKTVKISSAIFTISLFVYVAFSILLICFSSAIGEFYDDYVISAVLTFCAIFIPLNSLNLVPKSYMAIDMNFKQQGINESIAALFSTFVTLGCAIQGFGLWSIIYGGIVNTIGQILLNHYFVKCSYGFSFNFSAVKDIVKFALKLQLNGVIWFFYNKIDSIILGKAFNIKTLGVYNVAIEIANLPMDKMAQILNQVGFSAFSSLSDDKSTRDYYLERALKLISLAVFPVFFGISAVADELIVVLLTDKWQQAAILTAILAIICPFKMMNNVIQSYVKSFGDASFILKNTIITAVLTLLGVSIGVQFGLVETAIGISISYLLAFIYVLARLKKQYKVNNKSVFIWRGPFIIALMMWCFLSIIDNFLAEHIQSLLVTLCLKMLFGILFTLAFYSKFYWLDFKLLLRK